MNNKDFFFAKEKGIFIKIKILIYHFTQNIIDNNF